MASKQCEELCWINGQVVRLADARISVEDRGFQFADGVYETLRIYDGKPFALDRHLRRLWNSADGLQISLPIERGELAAKINALISLTALREATMYLQLTRGPARRNHLFPVPVNPTLLFYVRALPLIEDRPFVLHSVPDERWQRCWIKAIALLQNVMARNAAAAAGADEAVFIDNGVATEGASSNLFLVLGGVIVTHPLGPKVLPGVTREILIEIVRKVGIRIDERAVNLEEAKRADEVFITSSTRELIAVSKWDRSEIGDGAAGPITQKLRAAYRQLTAG